MKEKFKKAAERRVNIQSQESKLTKFSVEMHKELLANSNKGDWEEFLDVYEIMNELDYHIEKLYDKVSNVGRRVVTSEELKEHIADCANILLFLGNAYGLYDEKN